MLSTQTRPLSEVERSKVQVELARVEGLAESRLAATRQNRRTVARWSVGLGLLFGAVAFINAFSGYPSAGWALASGLLLVSVVGGWLLMPPPKLEFRERAAWLRETLDSNEVLEVSIEATRALVLNRSLGTEPDALADVLEIGPNEVVLVRRSTLSAFPALDLPAERLTLVWAGPMGVLDARAEGMKAECIEHVVCPDERRLEETMPIEFVAVQGTLSGVRDLLKKPAG